MRPGEVAVEHVLWSIEAGLSPREAMASLGWRWVGTLEPTWNDFESLAFESWRRLPVGGRASRAWRYALPIQKRFPVVAIDGQPKLRRVA